MYTLLSHTVTCVRLGVTVPVCDYKKDTKCLGFVRNTRIDTTLEMTFNATTSQGKHVTSYGA